MLYERGLGVGRDKAKALKWYRKAASQNFKEAIARSRELEKQR
ncbi:MAG: SEL1-like repeat protein [Cyanobacteria bacterium]|nr:SEL1-like repeat protein [Cyanobacteriota bacterium]